MATKMGDRKRTRKTLELCEKEKSFIFNEEDKSIRGSFVNLCITFTILLLVIIGAFVDPVAGRLEKMQGLIVGFFTASLGIWSYKKFQEENREL